MCDEVMEIKVGEYYSRADGLSNVRVVQLTNIKEGITMKVIHAGDDCEYTFRNIGEVFIWRQESFVKCFKKYCIRKLWK